jgi:hypothetical protein
MSMSEDPAATGCHQWSIGFATGIVKYIQISEETSKSLFSNLSLF